jgi:hypothetical protein
MQSSSNKGAQSSMRAFITHVPVRAVIAIIMVAAIVVGGWALFPKQRAHAGSPVYTALVLIHGFQDKCYGAFNSYEGSYSSTNEDTIAFLESKGWGKTWDPIDGIGYYSDNYESACTNDGSGTVYYNNVYDIDNGGANPPKHCVNVNSGESNPNIAFGYTDDPIRHIACELAWHIYNTYTANHIPVYVLAHSMGGLIIRDAIAEAGSGDFPPAIDVQRVVTVATPHGGVYGDYSAGAQLLYGNSVELEDMLPGSNHSSFMQTISGNQYQSPNGLFGTYWYLMAGSDACDRNQTSGGKYESCLALAIPLNVPYPDGDGVVQATSALQMSGAKEKVLYGVVDYVNPIIGTCYSCYSADPNTEYEHEANTGILIPPYYLNDATAGEQATKAWVCYAPNCTNGANADFSDMNITSPAVANPRSLQQMSDWLPAPSGPTPTPLPPTATPTVAPGACVLHPSDANCDNQYFATQGCNAYPQSETYNTSIFYEQLYYSTNCQSNWTYAKIQASGYSLHEVWIERWETHAYPEIVYTATPSSSPWATTMIWAPYSPARSCLSYKNDSTGAISSAYCTNWSPVYTTCPNAPNDAHCNNQDYRVQTCNDYPQTSPPPVNNGYVTITVHYSTNCQSNWAVATLDQQSTIFIIDSVTINRAAGNGESAESYSSTNSRNDSSWWSPMVWAPNNSVQGCVLWTNLQSYHSFTTCTNYQ